MQLQIRTRALGQAWSTVTEAALVMKNSLETFHIQAVSSDVDLAVTHSLTTASGVEYSASYGNHKIIFDSESFILFSQSWVGINISVQGKGHVFSGSEGMFGSWNFGGVRFRDGTPFSTVGGYSGTRERSLELARSWQVPLDQSYFQVPSDVCDVVENSGDRRQLNGGTPVFPDCTSSCDDIEIDFVREACKEDVLLTGDTSWACDPHYLDPIIQLSNQCEFVTVDDEMCSKNGDTCQRLGGFCKLDCVPDDEHVCLTGLCSFTTDRFRRELKTPKSPKSPKSPKTPKSPKAPDNEDPPLMVDTCQCYAPVACADTP